MDSRRRRHLSYANVAATLALVFSLSGGALAASRYLINSTKQISPKVLKQLKGTQATEFAYAHVFSTGMIDPTNSKNIGTVLTPKAGIYCFSGLSFTPHSVVTTLDFQTGNGVATSTAQLGIGEGSTCPEGTQITVATNEGSTGVIARDFFIVIN